MKIRKPYPLFATLILLLTIAVVVTTPIALSKYVATGTGSAKARIAKFDVQHTGQNVSFGTDVMIFWHSQWCGAPGYVFTVNGIKNTSEVTVRAKFRFYNVFQDNATYADNFDWTNPAHRRPLRATDDYYGAYPGINTEPRIYMWTTDGKTYSTTPGQEGVVLQPGDSMNLQWAMSGEKYRSSTTTNTAAALDTAGDFSVDWAYRVNYDIITTQID